MRNWAKNSVYANVTINSVCEVEAYCEDLIRITFTGPAAKLPSTSNSKQIYKCRGRTKIGNTSSNIARLRAMTDLYIRACASAGQYPPQLGNKKVHVTVALAANKRKHDSHNYSKTVGDWLETINLIEDDCNAQIFCLKKSDYENKFCNQKSTEIIVCSREFVQKPCEELIERLLFARPGVEGVCRPLG